MSMMEAVFKKQREAFEKQVEEQNRGYRKPQKINMHCRYRTRTLQSMLLRQVQELGYLGISRLKGGGNHGSQKG